MRWNDQHVIGLVLAARDVAFGDRDEESIRALDEASEKFAALVPWEDEPIAGHADFISAAVLPQDILDAVNRLRTMLHLSVDLETGYPDLTEEDKNIIGQFILAERMRSITKANEVADQHAYASESGCAARTIISLIRDGEA